MEPGQGAIARFVVSKIGFLRNSKRVLVLYERDVKIVDKALQNNKHTFSYANVDLDLAQDPPNKGFTMRTSKKMSEKYSCRDRAELLCLFNSLKNKILPRVHYSTNAALLRPGAASLHVSVGVQPGCLTYIGHEGGHPVSRDILMCDVAYVGRRDEDGVLAITLFDGTNTLLQVPNPTEYIQCAVQAARTMGITLPVMYVPPVPYSDFKFCFCCPAVLKADNGNNVEVTLGLTGDAEPILVEKSATEVLTFPIKSLIHIVYEGSKSLTLQFSTGLTRQYELVIAFAEVCTSRCSFVLKADANSVTPCSESFLRDSLFLWLAELMHGTTADVAWNTSILRRCDKLGTLGAPLHPQYEPSIIRMLQTSRSFPELLKNLSYFIANIPPKGVNHRDKAAVHALFFFISPERYPMVPTNLLAQVLVALHRVLFAKVAFDEVPKVEVKDGVRGVFQLLLHEDVSVALAAANAAYSMVVQRSASGNARNEPANRKAVFVGKHLQLMARACFGSVEYGFKRDRLAVADALLEIFQVLFVSGQRATDKRLTAEIRDTLASPHTLKVLLRMTRFPSPHIRRNATLLLLKLLKDSLPDLRTEVQTAARESICLLWIILLAIDMDIKNSEQQDVARDLVCLLLQGSKLNTLVLLRCFPGGLLMPTPASIQFDMYGFPLWSADVLSDADVKVIPRSIFDKLEVSQRDCETVWHYMMTQEVTQAIVNEINAFDGACHLYGDRFLWNSWQFRAHFELLKNEAKVDRFYLSELLIAVKDRAVRPKPVDEYFRNNVYNFMLQCFVRLQSESDHERFKLVVATAEAVYSTYMPNRPLMYFASSLSLLLRNPIMASVSDAAGSLLELVSFYGSLMEGHVQNRYLFAQHGSIETVCDVLSTCADHLQTATAKHANDTAVLLTIECCDLLYLMLDAAIPAEPEGQAFWPLGLTCVKLLSEVRLNLFLHLLDSPDEKIVQRVLNVIDAIVRGVPNVGSVLTIPFLLKLLKLACSGISVEIVAGILYMELISKFHQHAKEPSQSILAKCGTAAFLPPGILRLLALKGPEQFCDAWNSDISNISVVWNARCREVLKDTCQQYLDRLARGEPVQKVEVPYVQSGCVPRLYVAPYYLDPVLTAQNFEDVHEFIEESRIIILSILSPTDVPSTSTSSDIQVTDLSLLLQCLARVVQFYDKGKLAGTMLVRLGHAAYLIATELTASHGYDPERMFACGNLIVVLTEKLVARGAVSLSADEMLTMLGLCHEHGDIRTLGSVLKAVGLAVEAYLTNPKLGEVIASSEFMRLLRESAHMLVTFLPNEATLQLPCSEFLRVVLECSVRTPNSSANKAEVLDILITTQACFATLYLACIPDPSGEITRNSCVAIHCLAGELLQLRSAIHAQCNTEVRHLLTPGMYYLAREDSGRFFGVLTTSCENPVILWNPTMREELLAFLQRGLQSGSFSPMAMQYSHNELMLNDVYLRLFVQYACWPLPDHAALFVAAIDSLHEKLCVVSDSKVAAPNLTADSHLIEVTALTAIRLINDHVGLVDVLVQAGVVLKFSELIERLLVDSRLIEAVSPSVVSALLQIVDVALSTKNAHHVEALAFANPLVYGLSQAVSLSYMSNSRDMLYTALFLLAKLTVGQKSAITTALKSGLLFPALLIALKRADDTDLQKSAVLAVVNLCGEQKAYEVMRQVLPELILAQLASDTIVGLQMINSSVSCPTVHWDEAYRQRACTNVEILWKSWRSRGLRQDEWQVDGSLLSSLETSMDLVGGIYVQEYLSCPGFVLTFEQRRRYLSQVLYKLDEKTTDQFTSRAQQEMAIAALTLMFRTADESVLPRLAIALIEDPRALYLFTYVLRELPLNSLLMLCQLGTVHSCHEGLFALLIQTAPIPFQSLIRKSEAGSDLSLTQIRTFALFQRLLTSSTSPSRERYLATLNPAVVVKSLLQAVSYAETVGGRDLNVIVSDVYKLLAIYAQDHMIQEAFRQAINDQGKWHEMETRLSPSLSTVYDDIESMMPPAPVPIDQHVAYISKSSGSIVSRTLTHARTLTQPDLLDKRSLKLGVQAPPTTQRSLVDLIPEPPDEIKRQMSLKRASMFFRPLSSPRAQKEDGEHSNPTTPCTPNDDVEFRRPSATPVDNDTVPSGTEAFSFSEDPNIPPPPAPRRSIPAFGTPLVEAPPMSSQQNPPPPPPRRQLLDEENPVRTSISPRLRQDSLQIAGEAALPPPPPPRRPPPPPPLSVAQPAENNRRASVGGDLLAAIRSGAVTLKASDKSTEEAKRPPEPVNEAGLFGALKQAMAQRRFNTQPEDNDDEPSAFDFEDD